ncbi:hypothetical protein A9Q86_02530 [Flavobacteriales bacterium 33_180_T64]|nr:hypothetical protein A9Q86_02530 [Flavobacteriales bacterium 33_180_T64]
MTKPLFECKIEFSPSPHLSQIYDGFAKLSKKGIINLNTVRTRQNETKPVIKVIVNNKYTVMYDTLDGLNWINGSLEENLQYFKTNYDADYYFKRSYSKILEGKAKNTKIYPLGLNYSFDYEGNYPLPIKEKLKKFIRQNIKKNVFKPSAFEYPPYKNNTDKVLFLCRLWNPDEVETDGLKSQREKINNDRIEFVQTCKNEFGDRFTGGIQNDAFSRRMAKDLLMPHEITKKQNFIDAIKDHNICVTTTGLHDSTGWKLAEYVAASRAIISEPLHYELPGDFKNPTHYLSFNNSSQLINNINDLLKNPEMMREMMKENHRYYNNFVDSEKMILNTLLKIDND